MSPSLILFVLFFQALSVHIDPGAGETAGGCGSEAAALAGEALPSNNDGHQFKKVAADC